MHRTISTALLMVTTMPAIAAEAPAPFGLSIGEPCDQVQSMPAESLGVSTITDGPVYRVDTSAIEFEDLQSVTVICSESDNVAAVIAGFRKRFGSATFDRLKGMLEEDYTLDRLEEAHVGNQEAEFRHREVRILLEEPHMSRSTSLTYMTDAFHQQFEEYQQEETRNREQQESGQL